jgi:restriction endonuclease
LSGNTEISREGLADFIEKLQSEIEDELSIKGENKKRFLDKQFEVRLF